MEEVWKDIQGYEGLYQVSTLGNVKSFRKDRWGNNRILRRPICARWGYRRVGLSKDKKRKSCTVHRLVAQAFIPNPENKRCVNHKNSLKHDCVVENLEWVTHKENSQHASENGHTGGVEGEDHYKAKLTEEDVRLIKKLKRMEPKLSQTKIGEMFGVSRGAVSGILSGRNWSWIE